MLVVDTTTSPSTSRARKFAEVAAQLDLEGLNAHIEALLAARRLDNAMEVLEDNTAEYYNTAAFWLLTARVYLAVEEALSPTGTADFLRTQINRDEAYDKARSAVLRVLEDNPDSPQALVLYIIVLLQRDERDEALTYAYRLTEIAPDSHAGFFYVALLLSTGDMTRTNFIMAQEAVDVALRLEPQSADSHGVAAIIAVRSGNNKTARSYLRSGLAIDPENNLLMSVAPDIRGGQKITNSLGGFFRGLLARNPFDGDAHSGLRQWMFTQAVEFDVVLLLAITMLGASFAIPTPWNAVVLVALLTALSYVAFRRYQSVSGGADFRFVREVFSSYGSAKTGIALYAVALSALIGLTVAILVSPNTRAFYAWVPLTVIPMFLGSSLLGRARALENTVGNTGDRPIWMYRIAMDHQVVYSRVYLIAFIVSLPVIVPVIVTNHLVPAGAILAAYGLWYFLRTGRMIFYIQRAGVRESPWMMHKHFNPSGAETFFSRIRGFILTLWAMSGRVYLAMFPLVGGFALVANSALE